MSRLYYEETPQERAGVQEDDPGQPGVNAGENSGNAGDLLEKVAKLIPSEIIAGYLTIFGFIPAIRSETIQRYAYWVIFFLCVVLTPIYFSSQADPTKPKRNHLVVSTVAFVIWAYVTTGASLGPIYHDPAIASILLVVFSLVSAMVPLNK